MKKSIYDTYIHLCTLATKESLKCKKCNPHKALWLKFFFIVYLVWSVVLTYTYFFKCLNYIAQLLKDISKSTYIFYMQTLTLFFIFKHGENEESLPWNLQCAFRLTFVGQRSAKAVATPCNFILVDSIYAYAYGNAHRLLICCLVKKIYYL